MDDIDSNNVTPGNDDFDFIDGKILMMLISKFQLLNMFYFIFYFYFYFIFIFILIIIIIKFLINKFQTNFRSKGFPNQGNTCYVASVLQVIILPIVVYLNGCESIIYLLIN